MFEQALRGPRWNGDCGIPHKPQSGNRICAERYDRDLADIFALQEAKAAIEKLGAETQQAEPTLLRRQAQIAGHNDQRSLL
jgi:hypothetical protein